MEAEKNSVFCWGFQDYAQALHTRQEVLKNGGNSFSSFIAYQLNNQFYHQLLVCRVALCDQQG